jgi:hypothetical protein
MVQLDGRPLDLGPTDCYGRFNPIWRLIVTLERLRIFVAVAERQLHVLEEIRDALGEGVLPTEARARLAAGLPAMPEGAVTLPVAAFTGAGPGPGPTQLVEV